MIILITVLFFVNKVASITDLVDLGFPDTTFCYFSRQNFQRPAGGQCNTTFVPTEICTFYSLYYFTFDIDVNIEFPPATGEGSVEDINSLKFRDVDFNILLTYASKVFGEVISNKQKRLALLQKLLAFIKENRLDGIDFYLDTAPQYKDDVSDFMEDAFDVLSQNGYRLVVTLLPDDFINRYDIDVISLYADHVVLRTDLMNSVASLYTVPNSPIYSLNVSNPQISSDSVVSIVTDFLDAGLDPRITIVAFSASGLAFNTQSINNPSVGQSVTSIGGPGPYSITQGSLAYFEICEQQLNGTLTVTDASDGGYGTGVNGNNWIGFTSLSAAAQLGLFLNQMKLRGVAITNLCDDDFDGRCKVGIFPMILSVESAMFSGNDTGRAGYGDAALAANSLISEAAELTHQNAATIKSEPGILLFGRQL